MGKGKMFKKEQIVGGIVTIIIAPILAITFQKTAEYVSTPKSELTFFTISGPSFTSATNNRGLYALTVKNSGSTRLTNVTATMEFPREATIEVASKRALSTATIKSESRAVSFNVPVLFPGEQEWVSVFATGGTSDALRPQYSARSNEANGRLDYGESTSSRQKYLFLFGALGALIGSTISFGFGLHRPLGIGTSFAALAVTSRVKLTEIEKTVKEHHGKIDIVALAQWLANDADRIDSPEQVKRYADFVRGLMIYPVMSAADRKMLGIIAKRLGSTDDELNSVKRSYWRVRNKADFITEIERNIPPREGWT